MSDPVSTLLHAMHANLQTAIELVEAIQTEHNANGNDSLANIDYGASLNTILTRVRRDFDRIDQMSIFTAGWIPEE